MSVNKVLLKDDRRLINTVKQQGRFIRELKTPQKNGADVVEAITITAADGSVVGMGEIPDGSGFGFFVQDSTGNILCKIIGGTIFAYDASTGKNIMQLLRKPDGTYGMVIAKPGINVADAYS